MNCIACMQCKTHQCSMMVMRSLLVWCFLQRASSVYSTRALVRQGGKRGLMLGADDQLLAASPRSIPNP